MTKLTASSLLFTLFLSACSLIGEDEKKESNTFSNKLTVGTAADYSKFALIGEGPILYSDFLPMNIFWRLESAADMAGAPAKLELQKASGTGYSSAAVFNIPNPQSYGHILMSSFQIESKGKYRLIGSLVKGSAAAVDTCDFEVK